MSQLYCAADVTVHPTYYDPSSKVVIESLMVGTPAISTRYDGSSDLIEDQHGTRGRVVPEPDDVEGLAQAMQDLADPKERKACRMAIDGQTRGLSMKEHVDRLEEVLREAAAGPAAGERGA